MGRIGGSAESGCVHSHRGHTTDLSLILIKLSHSLDFRLNSNFKLNLKYKFYLNPNSQRPHSQATFSNLKLSHILNLHLSLSFLWICSGSGHSSVQCFSDVSSYCLSEITLVALVKMLSTVCFQKGQNRCVILVIIMVMDIVHLLFKWSIFTKTTNVVD